MFLVASGLFAMFFFNSLYIQRVLGYGPLKAGLAFLPFTAGIMVSAGLASKFAPKIGVRPVAVGGMIVTAAGMLLLTRIPVDGSYVAERAAGAGADVARAWAAVFVPLTLVATTGLENEDQGLASGLFNTSQQIGGALGLAILSTIAASQTASVTASRSRRRSSTASTWRSPAARSSSLAGLVALLALLAQARRRRGSRPRRRTGADR